MSLRFQQQDLNLKKSFEGISGQYDEVNGQIDDLKSDIRSLNSNLKDMMAKLAEKDTLIESLAKRLSVLEAASNIAPEEEDVDLVPAKKKAGPLKKSFPKKESPPKKKENPKDEELEADVDMGGLFGDEY
jgi:predicted  nucleic acid-binding Zn-ribbon protein